MSKVIPIIPDDTFRHSGGELPHGSHEVWAKALGKGTTGHFWLRESDGYRSLCDRLAVRAFLHNGQCSLFGVGTYPKCKKCMDLLRRR